MEKDYIIGQLEKKMDDRKYYLSSPKKTKEFVHDSFELVRDLKGEPLTKDEKKILFRALDILKKIQKVLR